MDWIVFTSSGSNSLGEVKCSDKGLVSIKSVIDTASWALE